MGKASLVLMRVVGKGVRDHLLERVEARLAMPARVVSEVSAGRFLDLAGQDERRTAAAAASSSFLCCVGTKAG